ncbi:unnamed protein product [Lampetra fluviatilis]
MGMGLVAVGAWASWMLLGPSPERSRDIEKKIQCNPGLQSREEKKQQDAKMMEAIQAAAYTNRNVARDPIRPSKE